MRGCAEPKKSNAIARFHPSDPQASESDNTRTKKRCCMQVIETVGQGEHKIGSCQGELGEPAVD